MRRYRPKSRARHHSAGIGAELLRPATAAWRIRSDPAPGYVARHDEVRSMQATLRCHETPHQARGRRERGVGHHAEGTPREPEVPAVGVHDDDRTALEPAAQLGEASGLELHRDHLRTLTHERTGQRTEARPDVEDHIAGLDAGLGNHSLRPNPSEPVPPPSCPREIGHGA